MTVQSVERALDLLEAVAGAGNWIGVRDLSRATGIKPPTAQNLLKTLAGRGYLDFDPGRRRYRVGGKTWQVARAVDTGGRFSELVERALDAASREFGETATACALRSGLVVITHTRDSAHELAVRPERNVVEQPHHLASGTVLLAFQNEEFQRRYAAANAMPGSSNLPASPGRLLAEFKRVRSQGYAERVNVGGLGVAAVAVPVRGPAGAVEATIALSAPMARMPRAVRRRVRGFLQEQAQRIESEVGAGPETRSLLRPAKGSA